MPDIPPYIRFHENLKADTAKKFRMDASESVAGFAVEIGRAHV